MNKLPGRVVAALVVTALGLANFHTQSDYLRDSVHQSWAGMLSQLRSLVSLEPRVPVMIGLQDYPKSDLVGLFTRAHPAWNLDGIDTTPVDQAAGRKNPPAFQTLVDRLAETWRRIEFDLEPGGAIHHFKRFEPRERGSAGSGYVVLPARDESVLNGSQERPSAGHLYPALRSDQRNMLVQVDTDIAHIVIPGQIEDVGLWQIEADFAGSPGGIQGIGRHVLFEVLNPVPGSRLLLDYTTGGLGGQDVSLPPAAIIGTERQSLGFEGRGAGRGLSEPVTPREIDGHFYLALDIGADAVQFRTERRGLAAIYNTQLGNDPRRLIGFTRNISLLSPEQVAAIVPPPAIASIPAGLLAPGLFFSGVTEDGWLADKAWFELALPGPSNFVRVVGEVPGFSPEILGGTVKLYADGAEVAEGKLFGGAIDLTIPIPATSGPREIGFDISGTDHLPAPDGRLVSIHLTSLALGWRDDPPAVPVPGPQR